MHDIQDSGRYAHWIASYDTLDCRERARIATAVAAIEQPALFTLVLCPAAGVAPDRALRSVMAQPYTAWHVWIPEQDRPGWASDSRIRTIPQSVPRSEALAYALARAEGAFVSALTVDISLSQRALYDMACAAADNPAAAIFYSDEDELDSRGQRCRPRFKTGWDPDLMLAHNAIGQFAVYRREVLHHIAVPEEADFEAQIYALALRTTSSVETSGIVHIPRLLAHRSTVQNRTPDIAGVVARFLSEARPEAKIEPASLAPKWNRVVWPVPTPLPRVSVIIPTRDRADLLARSTSAVLQRTDYADIELLVVDNGTVEAEALALLDRLRETPNVRVLAHPGAFNYAAMNNRAAELASGAVLLLLNNDTDVLDPLWLREMVSQACRPDVGIVGAKLLYEDGRVQHAGVVFNEDMDIIHQLRLSDANDPGEFGELALVRSVLAVTGASMCVRKDVYFELGGMDEVAFPVGFNDIDLCLRAGDFGYRVVVTPFATLTHFESATIGLGDLAQDKRERYLAERTRFQERWASVVSFDPFNNPNISYGWTMTGLAVPPRRSMADPGLPPTGQVGRPPSARRWANALQRLSMARAYSRAEAKAARTLIAQIRASEAAAFAERKRALEQRDIIEKRCRTLEEETAKLQAQAAANEARISELTKANWDIVNSTTWKAAKLLEVPAVALKRLKFLF